MAYQGYRQSPWEVKRLLTEERIQANSGVAPLRGHRRLRGRGRGGTAGSLRRGGPRAGPGSRTPVLLQKLAVAKLGETVKDLQTRWRWATAVPGGRLDGDRALRAHLSAARGTDRGGDGRDRAPEHPRGRAHQPRRRRVDRGARRRGLGHRDPDGRDSRGDRGPGDLPGGGLRNRRRHRHHRPERRTPGHRGPGPSRGHAEAGRFRRRRRRATRGDGDGNDIAQPFQSPAISQPIASPPDPEAQARKEAGVGIGLSDDLRSIRTALVKAHLGKDFEAAFDLMLFQLGRALFTHRDRAHALDIAVRQTPDRPTMRMNDKDFGSWSPGEAMLPRPLRPAAGLADRQGRRRVPSRRSGHCRRRTSNGSSRPRWRARCRGNWPSSPRRVPNWKPP